MKHGSLFSGIGGFDLAAEWMGWENKFHCEWNEFGKQVLTHYWPKAKSYDDITKTDFNIHRGGIDILSGGFPCQPYSAAGKRLGKEDDRHLWPEMLRAIREIQPTWVVGENVLGLVNWNGGLVFDEVQADLESQGYNVQPYVLPAASVGAPHSRYRVWFVAYSDGASKRHTNNGTSSEKAGKIWRREERDVSRSFCSDGITTYPNICRDSQQGKSGESKRKARNTKEQGKRRLHSEQPDERNGFSGRGDWGKFPTQPPICDGDDGISDRLDGITFPKWRNESIKAGGNAIVPQVAHQIFKAIEKYNKL